MFTTTFLLSVTFVTIVSILFLSSYFFYKRFKKRRKLPLKRTDKLIVGLYAEYSPFEFVNEQGQVIGFDVEFARELAVRMNKKLLIRNIGFDSLIPALQQGEVDIILSGISITPERLQKMDMIPYHGKPLRSFALLFWREIPENITSINDLKEMENNKISVQVGTIQQDFMQKYNFIETKQTVSLTGMLLDIRYGEALAGVVKSDIAYRLQSEHPKLKILEVPLEEKDWILGEGIGIRKGNKVLLDQVERGVAKIREEGVSSKIHRKWLGKRCCKN